MVEALAGGRLASSKELRAELKEKGEVIAPLEEQVDETARVVTADQQVVVGEATVKAWEKTFAPKT